MEKPVMPPTRETVKTPQLKKLSKCNLECNISAILSALFSEGEDLTLAFKIFMCRSNQKYNHFLHYGIMVSKIATGKLFI